MRIAEADGEWMNGMDDAMAARATLHSAAVDDAAFWGEVASRDIISWVGMRWACCPVPGLNPCGIPTEISSSQAPLKRIAVPENLCFH